jgi:hypothetical protein
MKTLPIYPLSNTPSKIPVLTVSLHEKMKEGGRKTALVGNLLLILDLEHLPD